MLTRIITWSLLHPAWVILAWVGVAVAGILAFFRLPMDAFPDATPVQVQINTVAPALSPLEVERQLTVPIEQVLSGLPHAVELRSLSRFGFSQVTVVFEEDTDLYRARLGVMERLQNADLPPGQARPSLGPVATGLGEVFHYLVTGEGASLEELRTTHDWMIKPRMSAVPGVAEVNSWGGKERQIQVRVDPGRLHASGISLSQVIQALEHNIGNAGGGVLESGGEATLIQGVGTVTHPSEIGDIMVASREGIPIRVRDLAEVQEGFEIRRGAVTSGGKGEVVLGLGFMRIGENSRDVAGRLRSRLLEIQRTLPASIQVAPVYERTTVVDAVLRTVRTNLLEGALGVIAILFLFLGNLRAGLIVASAIPLSMLFAFDLMLRFGVAGTLMSLGAIDFGLLVDSSVIQIENAARRLASDRSGRSRMDVVRDAALEVRRPTLFGELIIAVVYLPILTLEGIEGRMFRPMAVTVIFALLGSMALSLTLMPVLASLGLPRTLSSRENPVVRGIRRVYRPVLQFVLGHRRAVLGLALLVLANAALLASRLGSEFMPRLREGSIVINTVRLASVSLEESVRYGTRIEASLLKHFPDEIDRIWTRTGSAEVATDPMGIEMSDVFITLKPREGWTRARTEAELVTQMDEALTGLPGMRKVFTQPIEMRVNEMVAGIRSDLGVRVFGDDLEVLKEKARAIERVLKSVRGAEDVVTEQITGLPVLEIRVDREAIARHGVDARELFQVVEALGNREVGRIQEGDRRFPITVGIPEAYRNDVAAIGAIPITIPGGVSVPLSSLAGLHIVEGPSAIQREWGKRRIVVQANVRDRDIGSFVAEAAARIREQVSLPTGYYLTYAGQFEHLQSARKRLMIVVPIALTLIFLLLVLTYGRILDALRVFTGVPFAAAGGILALWLRDMPFSISAGVGFVALSGVSVLADMVLVSTLRQLLDEGVPLHQAITEAADRRLRPVLMTALVASVGFLPMALNTGLGAEIQRPLATVVIGGVVSSTLLTLLVLPVLYSLMGKSSAGSAPKDVLAPETTP